MNMVIWTGFFNSYPLACSVTMVPATVKLITDSKRQGLGTTVDPVKVSSGSSTGRVSPPTLTVIPERAARATMYIPTSMPPAEPIQFYNYTPPSDTPSSLPPPPFDFHTIRTSITKLASNRNKHRG
ncbi:Hypothetical predicted protein [Mytilus galloprovincialis]|uniref:Uncharacterized protein n=1 Tax=Mytilus galloprovincialis TaxID=29158 RepID=A0A8B6HN32_MYTGA|nr:Hypothetical predicted protein [Mytilus galloprovincialis]